MFAHTFSSCHQSCCPCAGNSTNMVLHSCPDDIRLQCFCQQGSGLTNVTPCWSQVHWCSRYCSIFATSQLVLANGKARTANFVHQAQTHSVREHAFVHHTSIQSNRTLLSSRMECMALSCDASSSIRSIQSIAPRFRILRIPSDTSNSGGECCRC
jgi:hypothetical protein